MLHQTQRRHPRSPTACPATMERRIRLWRALCGSEREVIFRQEPAGVAWSAVTDGSYLGGTITGIRSMVAAKLWSDRLSDPARSASSSSRAVRDPPVAPVQKRPGDVGYAWRPCHLTCWWTRSEGRTAGLFNALDLGVTELSESRLQQVSANRPMACR